jgi:hypothetical protein
LVFFLAATGIFIQENLVFEVIHAMLYLFLTIAVYGRFAQLAEGSGRSSFLSILSQHWFNFFVVSFILGAPVVISVLLLQGTAGKILTFSLAVVINTLTIYVLPLVFLRRERVNAIYLGLNFLKRNFTYSLPLILLTLIVLITEILVSNYTISYAQYLGKLWEINWYLPASIIGYIQNTITAYLECMIFTAACMVLIEGLSLKKNEVEN